jgi:hypothetical protein
VTSATRSYGNWLPTAARVGAWANVALETERLTRGARRVFIRYEDLLADWRHQLTRLAERLALPQLLPIDPALARDVDEFVDPSLYRNRVGWQELETPLPPGVREVVDAAWTRLQALAGPNADDPAALAALDAARAEYDRLYAEAEALAYTSIRPPRLKPAPAPALYVEVVRRIPVRYRRAIRRALHV